VEPTMLSHCEKFTSENKDEAELPGNSLGLGIVAERVGFKPE
jgi:hypothetical protein